MGKGQNRQAAQYRVASEEEPDNAQRFDFAGVAFQLELKAGDRGNHGSDRTAAVGAEGKSLG
jgi:hypothetical protein